MREGSKTELWETPTFKGQERKEALSGACHSAAERSEENWKRLPPWRKHQGGTGQQDQRHECFPMRWIIKNVH